MLQRRISPRLTATARRASCQSRKARSSCWSGRTMVVRSSASTTAAATCSRCRRGTPHRAWYGTAAEANRDTERRGATPTAVLLDPTGALGHLYGAQATPHMYVINADGQLVYMGAIDDTPSADPADIASSKNYVAAAVEELKAGKRVTIP